MNTFFKLGAIALVVFHTTSALAQNSTPASAVNSVTFYNGQGTDSNLREIPANLIGGNLKSEKTYFTGFGFNRQVGRLSESFSALGDNVLGKLQHGYVLKGVVHRGQQSNAEVGVGYFLKTSDGEIGDLRVNFSAATGLSYALGDPTYEDGAANEPDKRYNLQLLMLYEVEMRHRAYNNISLVAGVHHRSGAYGLIAPKKVGSNFFNIGIRYHF